MKFTYRYKVKFIISLYFDNIFLRFCCQKMGFEKYFYCRRIICSLNLVRQITEERINKEDAGKVDRAKQNLKGRIDFYLNPCCKTTCKANELIILKSAMTFKNNLNTANNNNLKVIL